MARRAAMQARSPMRTPLTLQTTVLVLSVLCCQAIRVPVVWDDDKTSSEVTQVESFTPVTLQQSIPQEYFEYKAHKPQFAVDVAAFHGVKDPEHHYKSYPIRPYTGKGKPELGKHHMLDENRDIYRPYQQYVNSNEEWQSEITPTASNYEVFHPYRAEEPALQELYKDPILDKIRNDLQNSKISAQKYENEAGDADIQEEEYLESPEQTDRKKIPQRNVPATFEIHRPLRRPVYYRPPPKAFTHEQILNNKFRHPWNQNFVKVRPLHYRPLKYHLHNLRQHHALKYDDEHNEYPQVPPSENFAEPPEGYDIYLKGQAKYNQLRNNLDESVNKAVLKNRPAAYQKLEFQRPATNEESDENEFVPIKNYAQVRKTETTKHLPKSAALEDAISYDDIVNAHRLREAVKSTKAQTVYTEEGYEDAAYDHAGEQKHASDHEGHGGFLKEKEISGGKFKTPSFNGKYEDASGSVYKEQKHLGKKWTNDDKDKEDQIESNDYSEDNLEQSEDEDAYGNIPDEDVRHKREHDAKTIENNDNTEEGYAQNNDEGQIDDDSSEDTSKDDETRQKRENKLENHTISANLDHDLNKREANFEVPDIDFNSTFLSETELNKIAKLKLSKAKKSNLRDKYPYYFINLKSVHKDSPLRYAENLKLIPLKSLGGTEFYDSRSNIECSEVDDDIDPVPKKIKNNGTQTSTDDEDGETKKGDKIKFDNLKKKQRLIGLGDKIDCFKAKYFGKNPLDSPFFKEQLISNPEPIETPKLPTFNLKNFKKTSHNYNKGDNLKASPDFITLHEELSNGTLKLQDSLTKATEELKSHLLLPDTLSNESEKTNNYAGIIGNIKTNFQGPFINKNTKLNSIFDANTTDSNYFMHSKRNESIVPITKRQKRAMPFVYEPYKIIREGQAQESKKTTTTGNISPLIKQLQSSKVVEKVSSFHHDKDQPVKRNVKSRTYKDISRQDREKNGKREDTSFIDVNTDQRRGEPRYELKPANHKSQYTPVDHKKAMSFEDYETQTNTTIAPSRYRKAMRSKYEGSKLPQTSLESAASKNVRRIVSTTLPPKEVIKKNIKSTIKEESGEEYDDYEDDEDEIKTSTTTVKPSFRRRNIPNSAMIKPQNDEYIKENEDETKETPKLQLVTRFNNPKVDYTSRVKEEEAVLKKKPSELNEDDDVKYIPKFREKKKKTRKSTLVTDTKMYGDNDYDDMKKDEVDALIGVKQNMQDYMPNYEKEADDVMDMIKKQVPDSGEEEDEDSVENDEAVNEDSDEEENDDYEDDSDEDEDNIEDEPDEEHIERTSNAKEIEPITLTTTEPTKRTLFRTTEAPVSTTEARSAKLKMKPLIHRKQVEIHSELPVNVSSPHVTQFKQDIKEVEIIKEMPQRRRKPVKNSEALNLFKDEKLAEEINKLKEVEVFKENLDLKQGPRHGGNYRIAEAKLESLQNPTQTPIKKRRPDKTNVNTKPHREELTDDEDIEVKNIHNTRLVKARKNKRPNDNEASNAKHIELSDLDQPQALHGGNLKSIQDKLKSHVSNKNAKLIELDEEYENDDDSGDMHGGNFKSYENSRTKGGFHGGNYRSAKLIQAKKSNDELENDKETLQARSKNANSRNNAAVLLSGFAKAVPILTTTPNYIVDPSKRMYYYVDT